MPDTTEDQQFDETFDHIIDKPDEEVTQSVLMALTNHYTDLGTRLNSEWDEAESERVFTERRWLKNLRQYRGVYDPATLKRIHPARSKAFIRLTRTKVKTYDARMMDLLFPANDDRNYSIEPTPVPDLNPEMMVELANQVLNQVQEVISEDEIKEIIYKRADKAAKHMEDEIADQLAEVDYRSITRNILHSGNLYGTGIAKGPFVKEVTAKRWGKVNGKWAILELKRVIPSMQFVPVWDVYPDMSAKETKHMRYLWQKHLFTKHSLLKLAMRSDFNTEAIHAYIEQYPDGNAEYKYYEEFMREMSSNSEVEGDSNPPKRMKYEIHERWGYTETKDVLELVPDLDVSKFGPEVALNVWMIDNIIIKIVVSPIETTHIPYYFYYFDKDETSIFGDGIPEIMKDPQQLYNASVRAMLDNAAISAGPIIEANIDLLADGEDPTEIFPFRVFQRTGTGIDANTQAIRINKLPSYTTEFLGMVSFFQTTADESTTIPRAMHGDASVSGLGGAGKTATGLSMLFGSSNITLKDQLKFYDEGCTIPLIKAYYFWNMEFSDKDMIKGDFNIIARGSTSLIAKEVLMENVVNFLQLTNNEVDLQYIRRDVLLRELAELFDLDKKGFVKSATEVKVADEQRAASAKKNEQMSMMLEAMKAQSSGHMPDAVNQVMQLFAGNAPATGAV